MASDGCQVPEWTGKPFAHLLHRPRPVESYGDHRKNRSEEASTSGRDAHDSSTSWSRGSKQDATGTWNGPAPRGYLGGQAQQAAGAATATPAAVAAAPEARTVMLPGGGRMPMVGVATGSADQAAISAALGSGYTCVDVTPGSEAAAAAAVAAHPGGRAALFVIGRLPNDAHAPDAARAKAAELAGAFGGYLDALVIDWPVACSAPGVVDDSVALADTWAALEPLVGGGGGPSPPRPLRALGLGNAGLTDVEALLARGSGGGAVRPALLAVELHPLLAQRKLIGVCRRKGVQCAATLPLAGGLGSELLKNPAVATVAAETGKTPEQVVLRWNVQRGIPVLLDAAAEAGGLAHPAAAVFDWSLSFEQKAVLDALDCGRRALDPEWFAWPDPEAGGAGKARVMLDPSTIAKGF